MSIGAILLAVGIPSFRSTIASNRLTSTTNDLVGSLNQARSEAIRRGVRVTVCKSSDRKTCATSGNWDQGWITYFSTTPSIATGATGETVIAVAEREANSTVINGSTDVVRYVSFSSDGTARKISGAGTGGGTLRVCESSSALGNDKRARDIEVSAVGRLSTTPPPAPVAATCPAP